MKPNIYIAGALEGRNRLSVGRLLFYFDVGKLAIFSAAVRTPPPRRLHRASSSASSMPPPPHLLLHRRLILCTLALAPAGALNLGFRHGRPPTRASSSGVLRCRSCELVLHLFLGASSTPPPRPPPHRLHRASSAP
jgi:hypothetical protein